MERERICGHIRSLKVSSECRMQANPAPQQDVKTLTLSPNPAPQSSEPSSSDTERPQFVCPLTLKVMNGAQPFAYLFACGCVFTQAGQKTVSASSTRATKAKQKRLQRTLRTPNLSSALNAGRSTPKPRTSSCSTLLKTRKTPCVK
ncbi:hypothetical protein K443DRAFT_683114 [Laccaria amethystina LaAM-08-1]|uniref:Replication termination factor 2 n=1 Tax=Laccaria amethystina LaAM-08-1 TaxID=1095629 RepID=A0A0C9WTL6_9AGAR|nr:hypothetical protein K443DRAFT_683114 [Laccaria amethystina LaAM-08-1]